MTKFQIIHYRMQDKKQSFFRRRDYIMGWSLNSLRNYDIVYFKGEKKQRHLRKQLIRFGIHCVLSSLV